MREEEVAIFWGPRLYVMRAVSNEKDGTQKLVTLNHTRSSDCQDMAWSAAWTISNGLWLNADDRMIQNTRIARGTLCKWLVLRLHDLDGQAGVRMGAVVQFIDLF